MGKKEKKEKIPPKKRGRKPHEPNDVTSALVRQYAESGANQVDIAYMLNINIKTLEKYYRKELDEGAATIRFKLIDSATQRALHPGLNPETSLLIFLLKTKCGLKESVALEHTSPDGSMSPPKVDPGAAVLAILKAEQDKAEKASNPTPPDPPKPADEG